MRNVRLGLAVAICVLMVVVMSGSAGAEMRKGAMSVTPFIGEYVFEGNQDIEDEITYGAAIGYNLTERLTAEGAFNFAETDFEESAGDVDAYVYRLNGLYHFPVDKKLVPFIGLGLGGITLDYENGEYETDFLLNYGLGLKYFLNESIALRGDIFHILIPDGLKNNLLYTLGLTVTFGGEKEKVKPVPQYKDSDGDGVYDNMDKCPGTPAGVAVNSSGCPRDSDGDGVADYLDKCPGTPAGVAVNDQGCPYDSDGDGVADYLDKCPGTPPAIMVDQMGCPPDLDRDGVADYLDECPKTPIGAKVDERGCWVLRVYFDFGKATIKPESYSILDDAAGCALKNPTCKIEVRGHTDNVGSAAYNQKLSERRAQAVMEYFVSKGVDRDRLRARGYGFSRPIATNDTAEGRAKNRRVGLEPFE